MHSQHQSIRRSSNQSMSGVDLSSNPEQGCSSSSEIVCTSKMGDEGSNCNEKNGCARASLAVNRLFGSYLYKTFHSETRTKIITCHTTPKALLHLSSPWIRSQRRSTRAMPWCHDETSPWSKIIFLSCFSSLTRRTLFLFAALSGQRSLTRKSNMGISAFNWNTQDRHWYNCPSYLVLLKYFLCSSEASAVRPMGIGPSTRDIIARCSRSSCVWNITSPVKSSTNMQPTLHMSQGYDQPIPRMTSGAL